MRKNKYYIIILLMAMSFGTVQCDYDLTLEVIKPDNKPPCGFDKMVKFEYVAYFNNDYYLYKNKIKEEGLYIYNRKSKFLNITIKTFYTDGKIDIYDGGYKENTFDFPHFSFLGWHEDDILKGLKWIQFKIYCEKNFDEPTIVTPKIIPKQGDLNYNNKSKPLNGFNYLLQEYNCKKE